MGRREPFVPEELAPKQIKEKWRGKSVRTERSFWHFFDVFGSRFFHAFFSGAFFCTWGAFGAPRCPKVRFWEVILMTFWWQSHYVKIDVLCRRELNSAGLGGSRNGQSSRCFSRGVKSAALGSIFADVCDFWVPLGIQKGSLSC